MRSPGVAFHDPARAKVDTLEGAMNLNGIDGILRAGGLMAAGGGGKGRNGIFIEVDREHQRPAQDLKYVFAKLFHVLIFLNHITT